MRRTCSHEPTTTRLITIDDASPLRARSMQTRGLVEEEVPDYTGWYVEGICPYGQCRELRCPVCRCVRMGWGVIGCPCTDDSPYPDMRRLPLWQHARIKPSLRTRKRRTR